MRSVFILGGIAAAVATGAAGAPLTPEMQARVRVEVASASSKAIEGHERPEAAAFAGIARTHCARAAEIVATADPDPYYLGEVSRCWGDAAHSEGDHAACDYWNEAKSYYSMPGTRGPTPNSVRIRLRWIEADLSHACGGTDVVLTRTPRG
ncbi:MAG TPA: hypothetical protein VD906_14490 [Caulobacteraceae bacterium]|nr:hypothetical protein [Caulobacteraceae bacterium]